MTMQTAYLNEHQVTDRNTVNQMSSVQTVPWWSAIGPQSTDGESYGQLKSISVGNVTGEIQDSVTKHGHLSLALGTKKGKGNQFSLFQGDGKISGDEKKSQQLQAAISMESALPESQTHFELGFGQPMIYAKYPYVDQSLGVFSAYGPQIMGRMMLPLNDGPIYVNAKQYHGIIRRRQFRARIETQNKSIRGRKPYMHESRHLHALRRPRGCGGRFLNTKGSDAGKDGIEMKLFGSDGQLSQPTGSQNSEVLQSESGTLKSPTGTQGSRLNFSASEVTSVCSTRDFRYFPANQFKASILSFSNIMDSGGQVEAAENCCNLNF